MMSISMVIADNHPLMLNGLGNLFRLEGNFQVVELCANAIATLDAVRQHRPDVLLIDICMPGKDGLVIARELLAEKLSTKVVFFTAEIDEAQLLESVRIGIAGIVLKEMDPKLLVQCVRKVHAGEQWIERSSTRRALEKMLLREAKTREIGKILTQREIEIIRMVQRGLSNKQIAETMFISIGTVKSHLQNIYKKLEND